MVLVFIILKDLLTRSGGWLSHLVRALGRNRLES